MAGVPGVRNQVKGGELATAGGASGSQSRLNSALFAPSFAVSASPLRTRRAAEGETPRLHPCRPCPLETKYFYLLGVLAAPLPLNVWFPTFPLVPWGPVDTHSHPPRIPVPRCPRCSPGGLVMPCSIPCRAVGRPDVHFPSVARLTLERSESKPPQCPYGMCISFIRLMDTVGCLQHITGSVPGCSAWRGGVLGRLRGSAG